MASYVANFVENRSMLEKGHGLTCAHENVSHTLFTIV